MPSGAEPARIIRLWKLVLLILRARYGVTQARLCELCQVSRMTIHRDLVALEAAGVPIERRSVNGELRLLLRTSDLPALVLDPDQVQALAVARRLLDPLQGTRVLRAYDDVLLRLGRPVAARAPTPADAEILALRATIESAMERRVGLRILYLKEREATAAPRIVEPLGWRFVRGALSLLAYDAERMARRSFQATRIIAAEALETAVREIAADGETCAHFAAADQLETLPVAEVVVRLAPEAAAHLHEHPLSPEQRVSPLPEGGVEVRAAIAGTAWPFRWVLSWGRFAVAQAPEALRRMLAAELRAAAAGYDET